MKQISKYGIMAIVISVIVTIIVSCQQNDDQIFPVSEQDIEIVTDDYSLFEKYFASKLSSNESDLKLIGYKTYYFHDEEEASVFKQMVNDHKNEMRELNMVIASDYLSYRIYFPLHTAIIEYDGLLYNANEKGVVPLQNISVSEIKVIGRQRSNTVRGTGSNIIKGDTIFLKNILQLEDKLKLKSGACHTANICVFDMDTNEACCYRNPRLKSGNEDEDKDGRVSCMQNHGGPNCSVAFGINQGRCSFVTNECIDYNGWLPNCNNHSDPLAFPGSDCFVAVSLGKCWNEIPK